MREYVRVQRASPSGWGGCNSCMSVGKHARQLLVFTGNTGKGYVHVSTHEPRLKVIQETTAATAKIVCGRAAAGDVEEAWRTVDTRATKLCMLTYIVMQMRLLLVHTADQHMSV